ncbi:hypothetical protein KO566_10610 [Flavobacteriaceae bacterium XHP0103]|uniref:hypothetical protein n=1 Tax=Marixanthotalea marina TaxID=2844359 RepID=UPI002989DAAF|nr:hypothetical protein [Marixanthotalea marina]MBU3822515.1 hypothetical protein [Marixanthotalea marina]
MTDTNQMIETIKNIDFSTYLIPVLTFIFGWITKIVYERYTLNFRLKKEFEFEQKKKLKEEIAQNKMRLLNSAEELNHRLWNFSQHVGENWHRVPANDWNTTEQYYLKSFVYRFLKFLYCNIQTEKDTISIDTTIAEKDDILFLKYIKTFKDIFTDVDLLAELNYDKAHNTNHFFKNNLADYCILVTQGGEILSFENFKEIMDREYQSLEKVINYFSTIEDSDDDKNLNVLRVCHLLIIQFLNTFGHDYQKTDDEKIKRITELYKPKLKIKNGMVEFIKKSKLEKEMKPITEKITKA